VRQDDTVNFPIPYYTNPVTILNSNGSTVAPNDGWIQHVCKVTNTPYVWAEITINSTATPIHNTSYQSLATNVEYLLTSPLIMVQKGTNIDTQMGTDPAGIIEINVINFYRVNYVGMAEVLDNGWEWGTLSEDVQESLAKADMLAGRVDDIEGVIPIQASADNQLADKAFVNSTSISLFRRKLTCRYLAVQSLPPVTVTTLSAINAMSGLRG
jgi:hypothetical protein